MVGMQSLAERCEHVASGVPLCCVGLIKLDPEGAFNVVDGDDFVELLAQMTNYAAVVMGPKAEVAVVRSVQVVGLSPHLATVVVVLSNGAVESEPIELAQATTDETLVLVAQHVAKAMVGSALGQSVPLAPSGNVLIDAMSQQILNSFGTRRVDESVFVGGLKRLPIRFKAA